MDFGANDEDFDQRHYQVVPPDTWRPDALRLLLNDALTDFGHSRSANICNMMFISIVASG